MMAQVRAIARFKQILAELVPELPQLRSSERQVLRSPIACAMQEATLPLHPLFITPMAAVAGAVADAVLGAAGTEGITRAYANNGGDIALYLAAGQSLTCAIAGLGGTAGNVTIGHESGLRGIATSGWRGRSQSLGIADAVTVLARSAAQADAAATMIANAVDCPGHPGILRRRACDLKADSDLGERLVTTSVSVLSNADRAYALDKGAAFAQSLIDANTIAGACLFLQSESRGLGQIPTLSIPAFKEPALV
jgi:hypothetical protein